jgi:hypothetical protein
MKFRLSFGEFVKSPIATTVSTLATTTAATTFSGRCPGLLLPA